MEIYVSTKHNGGDSQYELQTNRSNRTSLFECGIVGY